MSRHWMPASLAVDQSFTGLTAESDVRAAFAGQNSCGCHCRQSGMCLRLSCINQNLQTRTLGIFPR